MHLNRWISYFAIGTIALLGCSSDDAASGAPTPDAAAPQKDASSGKDSAAPQKDAAAPDAAGDDDDAAPPGDDDAGDDDGGADAGGHDAAPGPFTLTSPVLTENGLVPQDYTCATQSSQNQDGTGGDASPALAWSNPPAGTQSFAIVLHDTGNNNTHWVLYDIPANVHSIPRGVAKTATVNNPAGARQVKSYDNSYGYMGPCPGQLHVYTFTVYAMPKAATPGINAGDRSGAESTVKNGALGSAVIKVTSSDSKG